jgi:hypothetical protein
VTRDDALRTDQRSSWQLLLQFVLPSGSAGDCKPVRRIAEAAEELGLQPAEVNRIGRAVMEALRQHAQRETRDRRHTRVSIRVWVSDGAGRDLARSGSDTRGASPGKRRGWGFFLVEKQESQVSASEPHQLIELYLYQERGHPDGDPRPGNVLAPDSEESPGPCGTYNEVAGTGKGKERQ